MNPPVVIQAGRDYSLRVHPRKGVDGGSIARRRSIVMPKPRPGERQPRPYSTDDLDALYATANAFPAVCLISVKPPPTDRISTWAGLDRTLARIKKHLGNLRHRKGFPPCLFVTEFDPIEGHEGQHSAAFHCGYAETLTEDQQKELREWFLALWNLPNNQGRYFDYRANGGGEQLRDYLAKDMDKRPGRRRHVKFRPPWVPKRTHCRLWFIIGAKRSSASKGRKLRTREGWVRKRYEDEDGRILDSSLRESTEKGEAGHGMHPLTSDVSEGVKPRQWSVAGQSPRSVSGAGPIGSYGDAIHALKALSLIPVDGKSFSQSYRLTEVLGTRMLSLRLDMGGLDVATQLHNAGCLYLVCVPPAPTTILHMLLTDETALPQHLRMRLQPGTSIPRLFEVVYRTSERPSNSLHPSLGAVLSH